MAKKQLFGLIAIFWIVLLGSVVGYFEYGKHTGKEIRLTVIPVDPRDILFGDYVTLGYDISTVALSKVLGTIPTENDTVYSVIKMTDSCQKCVTGTSYEVVSVSKDRPTSGLYVKGTIAHSWSSSSLRINYGIERYYIPADTGRSIEKLRGSGLVSVIKVTDDGKMILDYLEYEGKKVVPTKDPIN